MVRQAADADITGWGVSPRGAGFLFGCDVVKSFVHTNNLDFIARAHQLIFEGYKQMFDATIVTVWSAPNYCYRCGNIASILQLDDALNQKYLTFDTPVEAYVGALTAAHRPFRLSARRRIISCSTAVVLAAAPAAYSAPSGLKSGRPAFGATAHEQHTLGPGRRSYTMTGKHVGRRTYRSPTLICICPAFMCRMATRRPPLLRRASMSCARKRYASSLSRSIPRPRTKGTSCA